VAENTQHNGESAGEDRLLRFLQGELDLPEAEAFEAAATGSVEHADTIRAYSDLLDRFADQVSDVAPALNEDNRARIMGIADAKPISQVIRANGGQWVDSGISGILFKMLFQDPKSKKMTVLARIPAGARMPPHRHEGLEECLVLEGSLWTDGVLLHAGDYIVTQDQTVHEDTWSPEGALVMLKTYMSDELLAA